MKILRAVFGVVTMMGVTQAFAQQASGFECTSEGAVQYETGLGAGVDDLVHVPSRLRSNMRSVQAKGWKFEYGDGAMADRAKNLITVRRGASDLNVTAQFAHEVGHANYNYKADLSSRDAYIRKACTDEGFGLLENIIAHRATGTCSGKHLGVVTIDPDFFLARYEELAQRPPVDVSELGYTFCERNYARAGVSYIDYYGDWYDANHGREAEVASGVADPALWRQVSEMAAAGVRGGAELRAVWHARARKVSDVAGGLGVASWSGGALRLSSTVAIVDSEIRVDIDDNVIVAHGRVDGRCVSRAEVQRHYPGLVITQPPTPHGPQRTVWSAFGDWGQLAFSFPQEAPSCLETLSLTPHPDSSDT